MKFITTKGVLIEALSVTGRAIVNRNNVIPILDNYHFVIRKNELSITGSNMELFLTTRIEIDSDIPHLSICVPANRIMSILKDLPDRPLTFEIKEKTMPPKEGEKLGFTVRTMTLTAGNGNYTMPTEDGENYPEVDTKEVNKFTIPSKTLLNAIDKTLFAVSTDMLRALSGVLISIGKESITWVGCSGHIMSTLTTENNADNAIDLIVPGRILSVLQGLPMDENITITVDDRHMKVQVNEDTMMEFVLMDDKYPDYYNVIPTGYSKKLSIDRGDLVGAIKRVSNFANQVTHGVTLKIDTDKITITAQDEDFGQEGIEWVKGHFVGADDFAIKCNAKMLLSVLQKADSDEVHLTFGDYKRSILIRESDEFANERENLFLVQPIV